MLSEFNFVQKKGLYCRYYEAMEAIIGTIEPWRSRDRAPLIVTFAVMKVAIDLVVGP